MLRLNFIQGTACCLVLWASSLFASAKDVDIITPMPPLSEEVFSIPLDWLKPWRGDFDEMIERGFIRVLTTYNKSYYFIDNRGNQRGITYDTFMEFERQLNAQLLKQKKLSHRHLKVRVVFIPVARNELISALVAGRGDIAAANLTITPDRLSQVEFTKPLSKDVKEVLLSAPGLPVLTNIEELSGKAVFVRRSSSYYESLVALNQQLASKQLAPVNISYAPEVLEDEDLIEMLSANLVSYIVVDNHKASFWQKIFPKININEQVNLREQGEIAWALRKDSPQLLARLNQYTENNAQGSKVANVILQNYLVNTKYVTDAISEKERAKFVKISDHFRKYGAKYDIDWLLMTAQGYQESKLNQAARSKVGAIGVMQVMPATGKQMNVGDIRKVEPNIHAGVKYVRWMIDNFYQDEQMTPLDKALFAFASYNAGPARITRLRQLAEQRGYKPNVWFANVEYLAAEKIGAETVTYVSNIYKYYIAYRLLAEHMEDKSKFKELLEQ
ncbi:transglycosylase SLT domain-containing protein [Shewanella sp.]|uniref:transglycosylase SLT domain-containing protein n=1 Tax=Shewanella sp. TaxID=50422 RepID=UPI003F3646CC